MQKHDEFDTKLYIAMHPARREILLHLANSKTYANRLADELKLNTKVVQFHLSMLEKYGLVKSEFGLETPREGRPVAVRFYVLAKDGKDVVTSISRMTRPS